MEHKTKKHKTKKRMKSKMRLIDLVLAYPDKPWIIPWLSMNPNITMKDVLAHPDKPWEYRWLSKNPNILMKDVLAHPEIEWYYLWLSCNKLQKHPHLIKKKKLAKLRKKVKKVLDKYIIPDLINIICEYI